MCRKSKCIQRFHHSFLLLPAALNIAFSSLICPYCRYILTSFYTKYDRVHFVVNTVSLLTVLIPKLPQLHGVRIFGINKYWRVGEEDASFPSSPRGRLRAHRVSGLWFGCEPARIHASPAPNSAEQHSKWSLLGIRRRYQTPGNGHDT